ncbi:unnamed protein product [Leuciscus chuanchicus]
MDEDFQGSGHTLLPRPPRLSLFLSLWLALSLSRPFSLYHITVVALPHSHHPRPLFASPHPATHLDTWRHASITLTNPAAQCWSSAGTDRETERKGERDRLKGGDMRWRDGCTLLSDAAICAGS